MRCRIATMILLLAACGPAVGSSVETDGAAGSAGADSSPTMASSGTGEQTPWACAPPPPNGFSSIPRSQVASSLAAVLCIAQEDCCPDARSSPSCRHGMNMGFEYLDALAVDLGLSYDGECAGLQQSWVVELGCEVASPQQLAEIGGCSIYFGEGSAGDPCDAVGTLGSTCGRGLACAAGTCVAPCEAAATKRPYVYGYGCGAGEVPVDYECRAEEYEGEACTGACADGLYCPRPYAACAPRCLGRCRAGEPLGSTCTRDTDCGQAACLDGTCAAGQTEGAPCGPGCGVGLSCDGELGTCIRTPTVCHSTAG